MVSALGAAEEVAPASVASALFELQPYAGSWRRCAPFPTGAGPPRSQSRRTTAACPGRAPTLPPLPSCLARERMVPQALPPCWTPWLLFGVLWRREVPDGPFSAASARQQGERSPSAAACTWHEPLEPISPERLDLRWGRSARQSWDPTPVPIDADCAPWWRPQTRRKGCRASPA
eukprot:scaffold7052_cov254-Pinguiococcus_pyrenoidosus.AAC.112